MSELREEQEMEAEALEAIFMESFKVVKDSQPFRWSVRLAPVDCGGDAVEDEKENHVVVNLLAEIPLDYPESSPPELDVEIVRGLAEEQRRQILDLAKEEAEANAGTPLTPQQERWMLLRAWRSGAPLPTCMLINS